MPEHEAGGWNFPEGENNRRPIYDIVESLRASRHPGTLPFFQKLVRRIVTARPEWNKNVYWLALLRYGAVVAENGSGEMVRWATPMSAEEMSKADGLLDRLHLDSKDLEALTEIDAAIENTFLTPNGQ